MVMKMAEKGRNVEKKVETVGNGEKKAENGTWLKELIEKKLENVGVTLEEIGRLKSLVAEIEELNRKMAEIMERRTEIRKEVHSITDRLDEDTRKLLEFLGVINFKEVFDKLYTAGERRQVGGTRGTGGRRKGNGLAGKVIVFEGQEYRQASYFVKKHGITGGMEGLKEWAESGGYTVRVEGDTIYIE